MNHSSFPKRSIHLRICFVCDFVFEKNFCEDEVSKRVGSAVECAKEGHAVSLLAMRSHLLDEKTIRLCQTHCAKNAIDWIPLHYSGPSISSLTDAVHSYHLFHWLLEHASQFDYVYFPFKGGVAYYSLLAKRQGWALQQITLCLEGGVKRDECVRVESLDDLAVQFLEEKCLVLADSVIYQSSELFGEPKSFRESLEAYSASGPVSEAPFISVCITHFNRPHYLSQALDSIRNQDYSYFEVILVDDASTSPEAHAYLGSLTEEFASKGWMIVRNEKNLFPGAARNLAARHSRGEYLLFMDDDNYAKSCEISLFVQAAKKCKADILTCAMDVFTGDSAPTNSTPCVRRFLPLGGAVGVGLYRNLFGDINALIKKQVFQALNGLTEDRGIGVEDWEFFARAVLNGYHLETIPFPLFWYRDTPHSITKTTHMHANALRAIRPYLNAVPRSLWGCLILGQSQEEMLHTMQVNHRHIGKLLKRCWQLFIARIKKVLYNPRHALRRISAPLRRK